ncbi:hypothetical protein LNQ52_17455 [Klebsiella pneumoniae subsp. pneumoniae]|nr:hypothetical protein [Klebsiella pneumoniae subsp. pneumoniae]
MTPEQCPIAQDKLFLERIRFGSIFFDLNEMRFHTGKGIMRRSAVTKQTRYLLAGKLEVSLRYGKSNMINYTISLISPRLPEGWR